MILSSLFRISIVTLVFVNLIRSSQAGKRFGSSQSKPALVIESVDSISTKKFFDNFVKPKKPLVIKSAVKDYPAFSLWSDDYLNKSSYNHDDFKIVVETEKKESRNQEILRISLREFIESYKNNEIYMVSEVPFYLKKDVILPQPLQCEQAIETLDETIMWFSSGGTKSVVHTDDYENILCVFDGIKQVVLVDSNKHKEIVEKIIDEVKGSYSSIDVDDVDYERFPELEQLEYYHVNLTAGDCLYIPFKWLHQVRSYDRNLAVNFWFNYDKLANKEFSDKCNDNKLDMSKTLDHYDYGKSNEINENDDMFDAFRKMLVKQYHMGRKNYEQWRQWIFENVPENFKIEEKAENLAAEFFNFIDFDGDGTITLEEISDLDETSLEQIYVLLNELEAITGQRNQNDEHDHYNEHEEEEEDDGEEDKQDNSADKRDEL